jgi:Ni2+-binding GTPase involved in maturation of urease and hydrogenase
MIRINYGERITAVETELQAVRSDVKEMRDDVKTLLAAYNRQSGAARLRTALWTGLVGLSAAVGGVLAGRGH